MQTGSIVIEKTPEGRIRRALFVCYLDDGSKARIFDLDSGGLAPRVVDSNTLTPESDDGPDKICAALDKLTAATEAQTRTVQDCNAAALDALKTSPLPLPLPTSPNPESELLTYLKIQQEGQQRMLELLLSSARCMADDLVSAFVRVEKRREKTRRRAQQADLTAQAEIQALRRDIANQGKALSDLRAQINNLHDEIKGSDDGPPAWFFDLNKLNEEVNKLSSRLSDIENR
jgi:hypothetical protein